MQSVTGRPNHRERGSALVEFAAVLPLLLILLCGIFEIGRALHIQQSLVYSAHEGARLMALHGATPAEVEACVRDVLGPIDMTSIAITEPDVNRIIRVAVESDLHLLGGSPLLGPFSGSLRLRGESAMLFED